jgi:hypothetical protein
MHMATMVSGGVVSRAAFFRAEEQWETYRSPEPIVQIRLPPSAEMVRESLREHFGAIIDAAFLSPDRREVFVYVADLDEAILNKVEAAETALARGLSVPTELHVIAHQGRPFPSHRDGLDRVI